MWNTVLKQFPRFTTLANTLAIALVLLSVFSLVVASSFQIILNVRSQQAVVTGQQQITALRATENVVALIAETVSILEAAAVVGRPFEESRVKRDLFLQSLLKLHPSLEHVTLLDSEGYELHQRSRRKALSAESLTNLANSDLFHQIAQQRNYIGAFSLDADTREPLLTIAVPIVNTFGTFEGGLTANVNIRAMWDLVAALRIGETGQVYVVDHTGRVLAYKDPSLVLAHEHVDHLAHVAEFMQHPQSTRPFSGGRTTGITGTTVVATVVPVEQLDWAVVVELPIWQAYRPVAWSVLFSAGGVLIVAVAASAIGVYLARRLVQPLHHLTETASRIAAGELDLPMTVGGQAEIGTLSQSFADMRDAIRHRITQLHDEIIERHHAEAALRESNERFQIVVDSLDAIVYVADMETYELLMLNHYGRSIVGDINGQLCWQVLQAGQTGPCEFCTNAQLALPNGNVAEPLVWEYQSTIDHRWYECRDQAICWPDGRLVRLEIATDITERRQAEEAVRTLNAELEQRVQARTAELEAVNRELKDFAYIVSHDLKAPLRAINRLVNWLVEDYDEAFDERGKEMLALLIGRVKRLDALIDGILEYSRVGRVVDRNESIDLNQLLPDILDSLSPPAHIRIEISPDLPIIVGDTTRILQVFSNLIGNAIKFLDKPDGVIQIDCTEHGEYWRFRVTDNGPGIEPQHYTRIFQIFHTLHSQDTLESTGLGLTIVKKIVELYGGKIWVESEPGKGSSFRFTFPKSHQRDNHSHVSSPSSENTVC